MNLVVDDLDSEEGAFGFLVVVGVVGVREGVFFVVGSGVRSGGGVFG